MRISRIFFITSWVVLLVACSNHPLVDNSAQISTFEVIHKIRCEAQLATADYADVYRLQEDGRRLIRFKAEVSRLHKIRGALASKKKEAKQKISQLEKEQGRLVSLVKRNGRKYSIITSEVEAMREESENNSSDQRGEERIEVRYVHNLDTIQDLNFEEKRLQKEVEVLANEEIGLAIEHNGYAEKLDKINTALNTMKNIEGKKFKRLLRFNNTKMAMHFTFDITEKNNDTLDGSIGWPVNFGTFSLDYKIGKEKTRRSDRIIKIAIGFPKLNEVDCSDIDTNLSDERARTYPITGTIGIAELVKQYLIISHSTKIQSGAETFQETMTFTTKVHGKVNPQLDLAPLPPTVLKANLDINSERSDIHKVLVSFKHDPPSVHSQPTATNVNIQSVKGVRINIEKNVNERPLINEVVP